MPMNLNLRVRSALQFAVPAILALLSAGCGRNDAPDQPAPAVVAEAAASSMLERVFAGLGGRDGLRNLERFRLEAKRERWILGEGPEPGVGLFRPVVSDVKVSHELDGGKMRLDYRHLNLYQYERDATELIVGQSGYVLGMEDYYVKPPVLEAAMTPSRWAANRKTERLLNPHILLRELLDDASRVSAGGEDSGSEGLRLTTENVYPVTLFFGEVSGQRSLLANAAWVDRWRGKPFYELAVNQEALRIDSDWLGQWQAERTPDADAHYKLAVANEIFPITLHVNRQTGRISKLATMEYDLTWGDVALEATYHDWRNFSGLFFPMRVKLSVAATPSLEVARTKVEVNPEFDAAVFAPPEGVHYIHDETVAARGARVSQLIQAFAHAGAPKKPMSRPAIKATTIRDGLHLLDGGPTDTIYTLVVEQDDGVVVVEPGFQDLKSEAVIDWIAHELQKPITHIVPTHHHVDHAGGIRPYAAAGAQPVVHRAAEDHYRALFARTSVILPDALDRKPVPVTLQTVAADEEHWLEDSRRSVAIHPLSTRHSTDSVLVFVRAGDEGFVYNGDLWSIGEDLGETIQNSLDMHKAIAARGIKVDFMIGSHMRVKEPVYVPYEQFKRIARVE